MALSVSAPLIRCTHNLVITPPVGASSLLASQNGALVLLSTATSGNQISLPPVASSAGCYFRFALETATAGGNCTIASVDGAVLVGTIIVNAAKVTMTSNTTLTVVSGTATRGDRIEITCSGSLWHVNAMGQAVGSITVA